MSDVQTMMLVKEEGPEEQSAGVDQKDPEHLPIKEELWTNLEGDQLHLKEETDAPRFPCKAVSIKSEDDEGKPQFSQLHQQQIEERGVPTSSSCDQMTAETSRNPDVNLNEPTCDSSETEVSGDDEEDVNLDSDLTESGPENGDRDNDWDDSKSSESDVKTINKSFSCLECGRKFLHKWTLQRHVRLTSHSEIRSSGCLVKKKCVSVKKHVDSCRKVQKEQQSFSCDDCGKTFRTKSYLKSHMRVHTGLKPYACEQCGQRFSDKTNLNKHMRIHTGQKPFSCELCGRRFNRKTHLNDHMRIHTGQKPFSCELCGQRFSLKINLNTHLNVHTGGQKPNFACELCGRTYYRKTHLNRHVRDHKGHKDFACELCGRSFNRKESLSDHMRIHTGQKPFSCGFCGHNFNQLSTLTKHMRIHSTQK